jgi:hypothetical protein
MCCESADFTDERRFLFLSAESASSADITNALLEKCIIPPDVAFWSEMSHFGLSICSVRLVFMV